MKFIYYPLVLLWLSIFGQVVLWFGQAKYTLYLSEGTSELKRKFLALLWLEISTCNICSSIGCLNCNSTIGLRSIKFYTNNNYLLQNILGGATHNASRVTGRPMSYEKKRNNCNSLNDDLMHTGLCPLNKLMK